MYICNTSQISFIIGFGAMAFGLDQTHAEPLCIDIRKQTSLNIKPKWKSFLYKETSF